MGAIIRLQWARYSDGFVVVRDRPPPPRVLLAEQSKDISTARWLEPRKPNKTVTYVAEGVDQRIFLDLANAGRALPRGLAEAQALMEERVLAFTGKWGLLNDYEPFPLLSDVWIAANRLNRLVERVRPEAVGDISKQLAFSGPVPYLEEPGLRMCWAKLAGDSAPRFFLRPENLLQFCYAEFLQGVGSVEIRSCPRCGTLFALGTIGQQRTYCSDACRIAMHRKRKREAELHASDMVRLRRDRGR
jgi:predicted nucleic acid-binding Zn ribbon protein